MKTLPYFRRSTMAVIAAGLLAGCAHVERPSAVAYEEAVPSSSPGTKYALLPTQVQRTVTAQAGTAEIKDINKVTGASQDIYEIQFRDNPTLFVAEDGTIPGGKPRGAMGAPGVAGGVVYGGASAGIGVSSLPFPVQKYLHDSAPGVAVIDIQKRTTAIYDIFFKDSQMNPPLHLTEDGTILKESNPPAR